VLRSAKVAAARAGKPEYAVFEEALRRHLGLTQVVERVWADIGPDQAPSDEEAAQIAAEALSAVRAERSVRQAGSALPEPIRVVIDPNVWVPATINAYGTPAQVVEAVTSGTVVAVVTQQLVDELAAVLIRPKFRRWITVADAVAFVAALDGTAEVYPDPAAPTTAAST
jgi:putative PIN family toxin of toxin-antitoxin system